MIKIKVKMIDGVWVTASAFDSNHIVTNLDDFYLWNIKGEAGCRNNKRSMALCFNLCGGNFTEAVKLAKFLESD